MKKAPLCLAFLLYTLLLFRPGVLSAGELTVGDVIGSVLSTDIKAYVNGYEIPSMNIDGHTAVVVEDLRNYGFEVAWNPRKRTLVIRESPSRKIKPLSPLPEQTLPVGVKVKDVLYTDIHTYVGDQEIQSFNIDGYTAIPVSELASLGRIDWDPDTRRVYFTSRNRKEGNTEPVQEDTDTFRINLASRISFQIDFLGNEMYLEGEKIGFGLDGKPMLSLREFAARLGWQVAADQGTGVFTVKNGDFAFQVKPGGSQTATFYNGDFCQEVDLDGKPISRGGDLYVYSLDLRKLFGFNTVWDNERRVLQVSYSDYDLEELGIPASVAGDKLVITGKLYDPGFPGYLPQIRLTSKTGAATGGGSSMGLLAPGADGRNLYRMESHLENLKIGENEVEVAVGVGERLLFRKTVSITTKVEDMELEIKQNPFLSGLKFTSPLKGYVKIRENSFLVSGSVEVMTGNELTLVLEKQEEGVFKPVSREKVPVVEKGFQHLLILGGGEGLYRVSVRSAVIAPHAYGAGTTEVARFYLDYQ